MAVPEARPNHTIYINNLNEKIKKDGEFSAECRPQAASREPAPSFITSIRFSSSGISSRQNIRVSLSVFAHVVSFDLNTAPVHFTLRPLTRSQALILKGLSSQYLSPRRPSPSAFLSRGACLISHRVHPPTLQSPDDSGLSWVCVYSLACEGKNWDGSVSVVFSMIALSENV